MIDRGTSWDAGMRLGEEIVRYVEETGSENPKAMLEGVVDAILDHRDRKDRGPDRYPSSESLKPRLIDQDWQETNAKIVQGRVHLTAVSM